MNPYATKLNYDIYGNLIPDMHTVCYLLSEQDNSTATAVLDSIKMLIDKGIFQTNSQLTWPDIIYGDGKLTIIDLNGFSKPVQAIILELLLLDLWNYVKSNGTTDKPFITVFDEAQNLNHKNDSSITKIINEGRKFGWASWFIMQSFSQFDKDALSRLGQASLQLFFKPPQPDIQKVSKLICPDNPKKYLKVLDQLEKGTCLAKGTMETSYNVIFPNDIKKIMIQDRFTVK